MSDETHPTRAGDEAAAPPPTRSIPEKLDYLFKTVRPSPGPAEFPYTHVEATCRAMGYKLSDSTIQLVRSGARPNPTASTIEALAKFFGVPPGYFFDEDEGKVVEQELQLLALLRDQHVRAIATRAAGLTPDNQQILRQVIESMRTISGVREHRSPVDSSPGLPDEPRAEPPVES